MKKYTLLLLPLMFSLTGCKETCSIKLTANEHVMIKGVKKGATSISAVKGQDLKLHLEGEYYHNIDTEWFTIPTLQNEGTLKDPNVKYLIDINDIKVLVDGEENNDAFYFEENIKNKSTLTLKKEFVKKGVEIKIDSHTYSEEMHLCLFGCELNAYLKDRYINQEIEITFESKYQNNMVPIKTLNNNAFPVFEDDTMVVTIKVKKGEALPKDLWYRTNARYAKLGVEFTRKYRNNYKECTISVPHYIMKDHCEIRSKV